MVDSIRSRVSLTAAPQNFLREATIAVQTATITEERTTVAVFTAMVTVCTAMVASLRKFWGAARATPHLATNPVLIYHPIGDKNTPVRWIWR